MQKSADAALVMSYQQFNLTPTWPPCSCVMCSCETPEQWCGLENNTRACIDIVVCHKWLKFQLWVNYPFKQHPIHTLWSDSCHQSCFPGLWNSISAPHNTYTILNGTELKHNITEVCNLAHAECLKILAAHLSEKNRLDKVLNFCRLESVTSTLAAVLPPGYCHCAGGHQFFGRHHCQVAYVHQQI